MIKTNEELLDAVMAAGITAEELTATLRGGVISVRNTMLGLKVQAIEKARAEANQAFDSQIGELRDQIEALRVAQVAAVGSK